MKSRSTFSRGFTLLELLVVMTIIAILAGGIFTAAQMAIRKARGFQAQNMAVGLASGINNFRSDYGRWPTDTSNADFKGLSTQTILVHLMGGDLTKNKRGRNFLDTLPLAKNGVGGLVYQGSGAAKTADLFDPWGKEFTVAIDSNNDGEIDNPESGTPATLALKVAVLSSGVDKLFTGSNNEGIDASKDNIRSW